MASSFHILLDGLVGQSYSPPTSTPLAELIDWAESSLKAIPFRAAVDLPSGLSENTQKAFSAHFTYVTGIPKTGLFIEANSPWTGRIRILDLGFFNSPSQHNLLVVNPAAHKSLGALRDHTLYKNRAGHVLLLGGSPTTPGAILMAAAAAVRAGAGLTTVITPETIQPYLAPQLPEAIWQPGPATPDGSFDIEIMRMVYALAANANSLVIGPGMLRDRQNIFIVCRIIREIELPIVLDASALSNDCLSAMIGRPKSFPKVIITPHIGEFIRLRGSKSNEFNQAELIDFAAKYNIILLLKNHLSHISDGTRFINAPVGGPVLARGGSGDILAGIIGSVLAANPSTPLKALIQSVAWHGAAADLLARNCGQIAVRTTQILDYLHLALRS